MTPYQNWTEGVLNEVIKNKPPIRKVTKHTRATRNGKVIVCPECNKVSTVYHFSWSALGCQHCNTMIDKYEWKLL